MSERTVKVLLGISDLGDCPMCGFGSLRKTTVTFTRADGTPNASEAISCGRCLDELRRSLSVDGGSDE